MLDAFKGAEQTEAVPDETWNSFKQLFKVASSIVELLPLGG